MAQMDAMAASMLPKNFCYYAGGHVHIVENATIESRKNIVYPGPTFPNSFSEIEKLGTGSFCIVENEQINHIKLNIRKVLSLQINCENKKKSRKT